MGYNFILKLSISSSGLFYKPELTPVDVSKNPKLRQIKGQRMKNGRKEVLYKKKWVNLEDFISS